MLGACSWGLARTPQKQKTVLTLAVSSLVTRDLADTVFRPLLQRSAEGVLVILWIEQLIATIRFRSNVC